MKDPLVQDYNPAWLAWFGAIRDHIEPALADFACRIEHVGSTSVPGLTAKPIIDLDVIVARTDFPRVRERLGGVGYFHQGDLGFAGREAFDLVDVRLRAALPRHHLYVGWPDAPAVRDHLLFRDFMRGSPDWVGRLSRLKRELSEQTRGERGAYMAGKAVMMGAIMAIARNGIAAEGPASQA